MSFGLVEWSKAVRARDGKCVRCGSTDSLHAHHIKRKSEHPELALEVSNGETLCDTCHYAEHKGEKYGNEAKRVDRRRLVKTIEQLEARVARLEAENKALREEIGKPVGKLAIFDKRFYVSN